MSENRPFHIQLIPSDVVILLEAIDALARNIVDGLHNCEVSEHLEDYEQGIGEASILLRVRRMILEGSKLVGKKENS